MPARERIVAGEALFGHCMKTYQAMRKRAREVVDETNPTAPPMIVYEGFLTKLIKETLNYSVPLYTRITHALIDMGCIDQLRRGGGTAPSAWNLLKAPTKEDFDELVVKQRVPPHDSRFKAMEQRIKDLSSRMTALEEFRDVYLKTTVETQPPTDTTPHAQVGSDANGGTVARHDT